MRKGFTLIELMLVVIIIGVLAGLVIPRLTGKAEKARIMAARSDIEANIPSALDLYEMDVGEYPESLDDLMKESAGKKGWDGPYLKKMPKDPWGNPYYYKRSEEQGKDYDLASGGKDGVLGNEDDITSKEKE